MIKKPKTRSCSPSVCLAFRASDFGFTQERGDPCREFLTSILINVTDPEIKGYLERARREGTPRPESQAVRAHVPNVIRAFSQAWELTFRNGVLDHALKELCRVYVSKSIQCEY